MREDRSATDETMETLSSDVCEDSALNLERPLRYAFGGPDDATREYVSGTPVNVVITAIVGEEPRTHAALIGHLDAARAIISWFLAANDQASIRQAFVYLSSLRPAGDSPPDTVKGLAAEVGTFGVEIGGRVGSAELLTDSIGLLLGVLDSDAPSEIQVPALDRLWFAYGKRGQLTRSADDYLISARYSTRLAELVGSGNPAHGRYMLQASKSYLEHYELVNDPASLEAAVTGLRHCVDQVGFDRPDRADARYYLGRSLRFHAQSEKSLQSFDEATHWLKAAVSEADFSDVDLSSYLSNLGQCLWQRHELSRDVSDLDHALSAYARSLAASAGIEKAPQRITNLINLLAIRINTHGYVPEVLNYFALVEARLVLSGRSEMAGYFFTDMAWGSYVKAYQTGRSDYLLFTVVLLQRAAELVPDSVTSLAELAIESIGGGAYVATLTRDVSTLKSHLEKLGIDVSAAGNYSEVFHAVITDIMNDLSTAGMTADQLVEYDLRDIYDIALFVHRDSLGGLLFWKYSMASSSITIPTSTT